MLPIRRYQQLFLATLYQGVDVSLQLQNKARPTEYDQIVHLATNRLGWSAKPCTQSAFKERRFRLSVTRSSRFASASSAVTFSVSKFLEYDRFYLPVQRTRPRYCRHLAGASSLASHLRRGHLVQSLRLVAKSGNSFTSTGRVKQYAVFKVLAIQTVGNICFI